MQLNSYAKEIGQRLLFLRLENGLSRLDVAIWTGIKPETLWFYETGLRCLKVDTAFKLANYYGVSIDWLAGISGRRDGSHAGTEEDKG